ncbi:hypothetical protein [Paenibacillus foliorum]|uniref:hypothetical protein n=1 Tax=Paenibacillus foliorum TaxID=2654974 RepID=UPI0014926419|nr:hypothetical protein [Paenibacillus foliorum]
MKLIVRLLFATAALGVVLTLGLTSQENQAVVGMNPMKVNQQQYERIHEPAMFVNVNK